MASTPQDTGSLEIRMRKQHEKQVNTGVSPGWRVGRKGGPQPAAGAVRLLKPPTLIALSVKWNDYRLGRELYHYITLLTSIKKNSILPFVPGSPDEIDLNLSR